MTEERQKWDEMLDKQADLARVLEVDATEEPGKTRVKALLKAWIASGALKVASGPNPNRRGHDRPTVIVGNRVFEGVRDVEE